MRQKQPRLSVFTGFFCCFAMIITGIATNGGLRTVLNFIHIPSMIVTFGGSIFAVLITTESFGDFADGLLRFSKAFVGQPDRLDTIGTQIYEMPQISRKEGLLALEEFSSHIEDAYMQKGIRLTIDGTDPERSRDIPGTELLHVSDDNRRRIFFWESMGACAPAWGMAGTLPGLINMIQNMGDNPAIIEEKIRTFRSAWEEGAQNTT